jgi:flagellar motility protein MotE (MotC chaperone)
MIFDDMRKEQEIINGMKKDVHGLIAKIEQAVRSLEKQSGDLDRQKKAVATEVKELRQTVTEFETDEMKRVKKLSAVYEKMEPKRAAETLRAMAESGKLDTAAKILATMGERQAAKVLSQLPDEDIAVQLLGKIISLKKPGEKDKK